MKAVEFKATEETCGAFYLTGDDGYWRDKVLGEFRALVPEYSRDLDLKSAYPFRTPEDIEEAVTSFSPFGGKVVVLEATVRPGKETRKASPRLPRGQSYWTNLAEIPRSSYTIPSSPRRRQSA